MLEGLRLRMDGAARPADRGTILEAARHACTLHQWLTGPDPAGEQEVRRAVAALADGDRAAPGLPLLGAAEGGRAWLGAGGARAPLRAALVRHWVRHRLIALPVPLTGAAAFHPGAAWPCAFLHALAGEAADWRRALADLERAWLAARRAVAGQRRGSQAAAVVDLLAAAPLLSATSLAGILGIAVRTAIRHLDELAASGIAVEVTHRASRRLFGLAGQAPLREAVRPPYRPVPGRGRGRPPLGAPATEVPPAPPPLPPLSPLERRAFDYGDLEAGLGQLDQAVRRTRHALDALARRARSAAQQRLVHPPGTRHGNVVRE